MKKVRVEVDVNLDDVLSEVDLTDVLDHYDQSDIIDAFSELYGDETYLRECSLPTLLRAVADKIEKYESNLKEKA